MNKEKQLLLDETYRLFMNQGMGISEIENGTLTAIADEKLMGFGTTIDEKILSVHQFLELLEIQKEQSKGLGLRWEIKPISHYTSADENTAIFADDLFLYVGVGSEMVQMYLRFSVILVYQQNKWVVIHWHGSKPENVESEKDTFGIENWKQKAEALEKLVEERTADLLLKNRELEIEAALERVRSRTMAMHKSEELNEIIKVLFEQFVNLKIAVEHAGFIIDYKKRDDMMIWLADQHNIPSQITIPYFDSPHWNSFKNAKEKGLDFFVNQLSFGEKNKFYQDLFKLFPVPVAAKEYYFNCPGLAISTVLLDNVGLYIENFSGIAYTDEDNTILMRFGNVFQQTYTRFLDLQKAEAQARDAEIELALERIRATTMAMQHSDELAEASFLLDKQVRALGIKTRGCAFNIYGENESTEWFSSDMGTMPTYKTPREHLFLHYYNEGQKGKLMHVETFAGEACAAHYDYLCTLPVMGESLRKLKESGGSFPDQQTDHVVYFKYGYLLFITLDPVPEAHDIFMRFAKVFEQTYTRFLDLQKAEAQATQAEQDLIAIREARQKAEEALMDLQATQKQLIQSEKMASLGELTAGIAHEIQNPLNFVNNFSEVNKELLVEMKDEMQKGNYDDAKEIIEDVIGNEEKINHHGKRADAIVKGMLQHSRSSSGLKEPTDINVLADEYFRLAYHGLRAKDKTFNATLKTDYDESIGNINIIPQDMGRVILNLITNAFYAVDEKKKASSGSAGQSSYEPGVSVSTKKINDTVVIKVSDNGNGIPQNIVDKIFQPFFTTKPTGQGTGLGLSMSYDIVTKSHGGELKVENNENGGATFIIKLHV